MNAPSIPFSAADLDRQRLETTVDQDLSSLSLTITSHSRSPSRSFTSGSSMSSIEVARSAPPLAMRMPDLPPLPKHMNLDDTPRPNGRKPSFARNESIAGFELSPASTEGHHISAATLGAGVFKRRGVERNNSGRGEFDPDRSLGRLVNELGKVIGVDTISPKSASSFVVSPRSPSPHPSSHGQPNLSFTLSRTEGLPSPPPSRSASSNSDSTQRAPSKPSTVRRPLQATGRYNSAPSRSPQATRPQKGHINKFVVNTAGNDSADVTGLSKLMATPLKGGVFENLGKNGDVGNGAGATIPQALATLQARLRALETENSVSRRRVRELETEVERAKEEVEEAQHAGGARLNEVIDDNTALEKLVQSLRGQLARLTVELEQNKAAVAELRAAAQTAATASPVLYNAAVQNELVVLRQEIERLSREVSRLGDFVEQGIEGRRRNREQSIRVDALDLAHDQNEMSRVRRDMNVQANNVSRLIQPSKLRQGLHTAAAIDPRLMPPTAQPTTRVRPRTEDYVSPECDSSPTPVSRKSLSSRSTPRRHSPAPIVGPGSPFPSICVEEDEREFFARRPPVATRSGNSRASGSNQSLPFLDADGTIPPQTVLARVLRELEDDFVHYKAIYVELADQYKILDPASAAAKRHVLAEHLKEVIDTLEQKADQIASLYDLLHLSDRVQSAKDSSNQRPSPKKSVSDLLRTIRESLGEEALRRLEEDGLLRRAVRSRRI